MNGFGSGSVCPSSVTWYSCITSSRALCVFAGARLISSASSTCVNTGPRTIRSSRVDGSSTAWPVMSDGIMSGVNCTRAWASDSACASARTSSVLPRPGTPSIRTCPDATSATSTCSMTADCPTIAWPIAARRSSSSAAACGMASVSTCSMMRTLCARSESGAARLRAARSCCAARGSGATRAVVNRGREGVPIEAGETRQGGGAVRSPDRRA